MNILMLTNIKISVNLNTHYTLNQLGVFKMLSKNLIKLCNTEKRFAMLLNSFGVHMEDFEDYILYSSWYDEENQSEYDNIKHRIAYMQMLINERETA